MNPTPELLAEIKAYEKPQPKPGDKIVVWFSCGAASAIAAKRTIEKYGDTCEVIIVNNPIKEEDEDNQRFLRDCEKWLGVKIHSAINSKYKSCSIVEVFDDQQFMNNNKGLAYCTLELKQRARFEWESKNRPDWTIMGFTKEEDNRFDRFKLKRQATIHILWTLHHLAVFVIPYIFFGWLYQYRLHTNYKWHMRDCVCYEHKRIFSICWSLAMLVIYEVFIEYKIITFSL